MFYRLCVLYAYVVGTVYRMRLDFRGTKLSRMADSHILADFTFADEGVVHILYCMYTL